MNAHALGQCEDVNGNSICDVDESGCTIELACNYDATALFDDGSCDFVSCLSFGCTDGNACNYDEGATYDDGTCSYPAFPYDCDGACITDTDGDGICDEFETLGCTDSGACNYSSGATQDDGSCSYDCQGCTEPGACNFDPSALIDDGSCEFESCLSLGCTDVAACNYDAEAAYNDGSCDYTSCLGCTDESACNFDPSSTQDDGSCVFAETGLDCDGNCLSDADGDGICDDNEVPGCTDEAACNYDASATDDDGTCDFCSCAPSGGLTSTTSVAGYDVEIETVMEHTSGDLAGMTTYRVYLSAVAQTDGVSAVVGDNEFPLSFATTTTFYQEPIFGGATPANISGAALGLLPILAYDSWVTIGLDGPASSANGEVNASLLAGTWDDTFEGGNSFVVNDNQGSGWYLLPPTATNSLAGTELRVLVAQLTTDGDISGSFRAQVFPEGDQENDHRVDVTFSMSGDAPVCGCTDELASNFDPSATLNDGSCVYDVLGCTIEIACNYNAEATLDDGSCDFVSCLAFGCTDAEACNYDESATFDDGTCTYASFPYDCDGNCVNDNDQDGVCDEFEIFGCTDADACNFSEGATDDDGSCTYDCLGCTNPVACNYDASALIDDGSCDFTSCIVVGCTDAMACNFDADAQYDDGTCTYIPEGACDCDGNVEDALGECGGSCGADDNGNGVCDDAEVYGCTSSFACNYDPTATVDDGSCDFISCLSFGCTDPNACNFDPTAQFDDGSCTYDAFPYDCDGNCYNDADSDGICDELEIPGCTDVNACNFNADATDDAGNCTYPEEYFDCDGICLNDMDGDGICDELEVPGCTDATACNFNGMASDDDGSCQYLDACGECGGPGEIYECGCSDIPEGDCDCDGNQLDALGVCGGDCTADADADGICDDVDDCVGAYDACGVCNGPGEIYECGCSDIPEGDCDCDGNQLDALGVCGGDCTADADADGICDDVDDCVGAYDACGVCNGPGEIYECGCSDIPEGDCDCDGNQLDALGVCGGDCTADADADGICDDVDDCVGAYDACGVCNGPGEIYECGCSDIPEGDCDCDGNQLDVLGVCGGDCAADADADGICDDVDDCVGAYDACGVCNGPGEIYECGCSDIPEGDCDCDGNQLDALGVCGGDCAADADADGICDDVDDCVGAYDACGVCNGPGEIYECGCSDIPEGDCDCDGNQLDALGVCGGTCTADADADGICDDVDDCVGAYDACGVCNGPGEIYECGCSDIPEGDCDCDGNQLDALGVCGGDCTADADADGICDDVDDCVGAYDACGVCNGPGEIFECGCSDIPEGDCDCDGNQLDALGVCGGDCAADENGNGICDDAEILGCTVSIACNYDPAATQDDGSCDFTSCLPFGCTDVAACNYDGEALYDDGSCEYANFPYDCDGGCVNDSDGDGICDELELPGCTDTSACNFNPDATDDAGNCIYPTEYYDCDGNCINDADGNGLCDELEVLGCTDYDACNFDPSATQDDGSCAELDACGICGGPGAVYECGCSDIPEGDCDCDGNQLDALGVCGGDCTADADADGICDDVDDCVGAYDACGVCNGPGEIYECGCSDIPEGDCDCDGNQLDALGVCGGDCTADADADGICDDVDDCVGAYDACGVCNGPGEIYECGCSDIPEGDCDCDGNQLDVLGVCGGDCAADADADGICDDVDDCVGAYDACGVCNGPGEIYECGCSDIPEGDCDCDGNQLDALGVCGGDCTADADADGICDDVDDCVGAYDACGVCNGPGEIFECGCSDIPEGDCDCDGNQLDALGVCGGDCTADADADGICDDVDDCVGAYDACGVCNGPGEIYECGCSDIPEGDCDCDGNQLDALGVCGGDCAADADADGICDDVDDCVGAYDACGVCNGPGEIYECGCSDIPEGDCDCDGNQLDALGVCGGTCTADADADGICDDVDDCVGAYDACGVCNGPGEIYECGCSDIPEGDCDCDGNQLDALGVCGGDCAADADADGICDDVDDCVGAYDACGVCNGPGEIYECGCSDIPEGDCDCDGNQLDALGVCGGDCTADADADGICDDVDDCVGAYDACGVCNGPGEIYECGCSDIPEGDCDCDGNQLDALGVCGGDCTADADADGICDDVDDCVGAYDACGVCNGPGEIYECGCSDIPEGDCDCDGNQLDALGVCGGDCTADADADGICDDVDDCVGAYDACGVCNGPGEIYECGCSDIPEGDCDCDGNQLDVLGVCGGDCAADADADGICDDVDDCVGAYDACGVCNGPGEIYECGCSDIPEGDCDCDGNQLDALGVCGGDCAEDINGNGICDIEEECLGIVDECGVCDGPGAIYECGCSDIPEGDCDCDGNQLDALGVCGGDCTADADADGICDDVDDCVGAYDACGVCNGPGEIYECGCSDIPEGDCDCDGNQLDALGVCGGDCAEDANGNGLCDADEVQGCTDVTACNYDADATFDDGSCAELDACGVCGGPGAVYECGCSDIPEGDCDCDGNQLDAIGVCGGDCTEDVNENSICDTDEQGCTDPTNPNYDPNAAFDDGSCFVGGCTFPSACNYNPDADYQLQGSCDFTSCQGCTNPEACNYDPEATIDNGLCDLPDFAYDCEGNCLNDSDGDGVCDELEVLGCTDVNSPNFDPYATDDDGTCLVGGCNIPAACNFDPSADYLIPGACEFASCVGCMDEEACNFDPGASVPNLNLCTYPPGLFLDCDGACVNDTDEDGVCDQFEIPGCTDPEAQNFNPQATDDNGTCQAPLVGGCILPFACNYDPNANFYIPGSCEFAPCGGVAQSDNCTHPDACNYGAEGPCEFLSCVVFGCNVSVACNYDPEAQFNDGTCEYSSCMGCMNESACDFNPLATLAGGCYDYTSCAGCLDADADNYDPTATLGNGLCIFNGCTIPGACNFDVTANSNDGSCDFTACAGCLDDAACNYDSGASIAGYCDYPSANFDCDGNCLLEDCSAFEVAGCTDACACNYDPFANTADGSCEFESCSGCVYFTAENYDPSATRDDGSCIFEGCTDADFATYSTQANASNDDWCSNAPASADFNDDGLVQVEDLTQFLQAYSLAAPSWGGVDWVGAACAVDALSEEEMLAALLANQTAGPWNPACGVPGCSYPGALNFDPSAGQDNGVCLFAGCTDVEALNYDRLATVDDNTCRYEVCPDFNGDGQVQISDLMDFLLLWGN